MILGFVKLIFTLVMNKLVGFIIFSLIFLCAVSISLEETVELKRNLILLTLTFTSFLLIYFYNQRKLNERFFFMYGLFFFLSIAMLPVYFILGCIFFKVKINGG